MFDVVQKTNRLNAMRCFASLLISISIHAAAFCAVVVVPLVFFNVLHAEELLVFLMPSPPTPVPPPPPFLPRNGTSAVRHSSSTVSADFAPQGIPDGILPPVEESPMAIGVGQVLEGIGVSTGLTDGTRGMPGSLIPTEPIYPPPLPPPPKRTPVRIGVLEPSKCIFQVDPVFPRLARIAGISGAVILEAIIDEEGNISEIKILSGHPLLRDAAVEAVRQWKYSPTILNGEPVPVVATVTIVFKLR